MFFILRINSYLPIYVNACSAFYLTQAMNVAMQPEKCLFHVYKNLVNLTFFISTKNSSIKANSHYKNIYYVI